MHFFLNKRSRHMPEIGDVPHNDNLSGRESGGNHMHAASKGNAHSLDGAYRG
jgi:hypothetical protein